MVWDMNDIDKSHFLFPILKFELVKFCYIFFILYAINDILLKTIKNNIVACLCNVFYTTKLEIKNVTCQYHSCPQNIKILHLQL
jgi:hypothetical protein